eukprot:TRINITY_DN6391_c1_g1_i1.p1 TRINITY_DN6391_c1_g1~~TRINITY_DN6391_c1_g1_i1.p1  ORF type:complete len:624 (+),score=110.96 TRINITY_DN6391_c1_g1_i1:88-1872(+)
MPEDLKSIYTGVVVAVWVALMFIVLGVTYLTLFICSQTRYKQKRGLPRASYIASTIAIIATFLFLGLMGFSASAMNYVNPWLMIVLVWILWTGAMFHHFRQVTETTKLEEELSDFDGEKPKEKKKSKMDWTYKGIKLWIVTESRKYVHSIRNGTKRRWKTMIVVNLILLAISFVIGGLTMDTCFCIEPVEITTRFSRLFSPDPCEARPICHAYFTLAENPTTEIIANFQSSREPTRGWIDYRIEGTSTWNTAETTFFRAAMTEVTRWVHWSDISQLEPGTVYEFRFNFRNLESDQDETSDIYKTRTIPSSGNVTFLSGGDMSSNDRGNFLSRMGASHSPHFAVVAGDVGYANGFIECYRRWDKWLNDWENYMKTPEGYQIIMTLGIGNHEAGGDFDRPRSGTPFYFEYFPQSFGWQRYHPNQRPSYHAHNIANHTLLLMLDSGVVTSMLGEQFDWMQSRLANAQHLPNRITAYHYPLFPSVTRWGGIPQSTRDVWSSEFSRSNVTVAFENHYHVFKKTKAVDTDGVDAVDGVVYLGDGAWGTDGALIPIDRSSWWMESADPRSHVFLVTANEKMLLAEARDVNNEAFDTYVKYH